MSLGCGTSTVKSAQGAAPGAAASSLPLTSPTLGYVWDASASALRPVMGVSGAASVGAPLFAGRTFTAGVASPRLQYALLTESNGQVELATLPSGVPSPLTGQLSANQRLALSASGNNALLYAPDARTMILIEGLPAAPSLHTITLPSATLPAQASVSDDGLMLTSTAASDGSSTLQVIRLDGSSAQVATVASLGGMAFVPHTESALFADAARNLVQLASHLDLTPSVTQIAAGSTQGIQQPIAIAASSDGHWGIVASANNTTVVRLDLSGQSTPLQVRCSCSPVLLQPMLGNDVFLLTALGTRSITLFDGDAPTPRTAFVAGLQQASARSSAQ